MFPLFRIPWAPPARRWIPRSWLFFRTPITKRINAYNPIDDQFQEGVFRLCLRLFPASGATTRGARGCRLLIWQWVR